CARVSDPRGVWQCIRPRWKLSCWRRYPLICAADKPHAARRRSASLHDEVAKNYYASTTRRPSLPCTFCRLDSAPCCGLIGEMQPSEALGVAAQVAVTLAGFGGIVVVFRPQSVHQWSPLDRLGLTLLLMNSVVPLVFALFGMLLLCIDPVPVSSGAGAAAPRSSPTCFFLFSCATIR